MLTRHVYLSIDDVQIVNNETLHVVCRHGQHAHADMHDAHMVNDYMRQADMHDVCVSIVDNVYVDITHACMDHDGSMHGSERPPGCRQGGWGPSLARTRILTPQI